MTTDSGQYQRMVDRIRFLYETGWSIAQIARSGGLSEMEVAKIVRKPVQRERGGETG